MAASDYSPDELSNIWEDLKDEWRQTEEDWEEDAEPPRGC